MLSDVTISLGGQSVSFPGLYLLIGLLIILGLVGFIVAMTSTRRIERRTSEATDILVVQLERIGDALDRIVSQNATRVANEPLQARERPLAEWTVPGRGIPTPSRLVADGGQPERPAQKVDQPAIALASTSSVQAAPNAPPAPSAQASGAPSAQDKKTAEDPTAESTLSEPVRSILFSMLGR